MALALFAVIAAAAAPLLSSAFVQSHADQASAAIEEAALALHAGAVATGEHKLARVTPRGLEPGDPLPDGWKLEVRRLTDSRFRAPRDGETWEFNSAGICEPLQVRLSGDGETVELRFDALTAQTLDE